MSVNSFAIRADWRGNSDTQIERTITLRRESRLITYRTSKLFDRAVNMRPLNLSLIFRSRNSVFIQSTCTCMRARCFTCDWGGKLELVKRSTFSSNRVYYVNSSLPSVIVFRACRRSCNCISWGIDSTWLFMHGGSEDFEFELDSLNSFDVRFTLATPILSVQ